MDLERLTLEHFLTLRPQPAQCGASSPDYSDPAYRSAMVACAGSWAVVRDGVTLGIGGTIDLGGGRAYAWSVLSGAITDQFLAMHRKVVSVLDTLPYHRIEMHVDCDHPAAIRWARLLGFDLESTCRGFYPDGRNAFMFVRRK